MTKLINIQIELIFNKEKKENFLTIFKDLVNVIYQREI